MKNGGGSTQWRNGGHGGGTLHLQGLDCGFHCHRELCKEVPLIHPLDSASTLVGQRTLDSSVGIPIGATEVELQGLPAVNYSAGISIVASAAELQALPAAYPYEIQASLHACP